MFDFRYHALSLAAVIVALVLGLLLGVAIGDKGLVSNAEDSLRRDLRSDVREAQAQVRTLQAQVDRHERYESQTFGTLVGDELTGRRIDLLFIGDRSEPVFAGVRDALAPTGAELRFVSTLRVPLDREAVARLAAGTRFGTLGQDPALLGDLGARIGREVVTGGKLLHTLRPELLSSSSGQLGRVEGVVIARSPKLDALTGDAASASNAFVDGLIRGLRGESRAVVGVEDLGIGKSQVPWYDRHGLASVDDVDEVSGKASMVFVLAGAADGNYGSKSTADALIPDALVRTTSSDGG